MEKKIKIHELSHEQQDLWKRVKELWSLAQSRNADAIRESLHTRYIGWEADSPVPHDREFAVQSVVSGTYTLLNYELHPVGIEVYDGKIGIAHYTYTASISEDGVTRKVTGRWTESYLKQNDKWILVGEQGGQDRVS